MIGEKNRQDDGKGEVKLFNHDLHTADLHCPLIPPHFLYYSLTAQGELLRGNI